MRINFEIGFCTSFNDADVSCWSESSLALRSNDSKHLSNTSAPKTNSATTSFLPHYSIAQKNVLAA